MSYVEDCKTLLYTKYKCVGLMVLYNILRLSYYDLKSAIYPREWPIWTPETLFVAH